MLIERYLERPRHIEVQVFGDTQGNVVHLFERDCSVQRRHQKVLEEAPAPGLAAKKRMEMGEAAVAAAKAVGYSGAGTIEFIAEQDGRFYFMEMNTRLQVEHPVTEMITGVDLVEWQLRVAAGEPLPATQEKLVFRGHAIEARIYAEDPARDFLPATGRIAHLRFPEESARVRIDTGVGAGAEITPWYDPMIAKLIVHGSDRGRALARLRQALAEVEIAGPKTNVAFLRRLAASRAFAAPELDTGLIERNREELLRLEPISDELLAAAALAEILRRNARRRSPCHGLHGSILALGSSRRLAPERGLASRSRISGRRKRAIRYGFSFGKRLASDGERQNPCAFRRAAGRWPPASESRRPRVQSTCGARR